MKLFLTHFVKFLDDKQRDWRKSMVLMHDNAPYFRSQDTMGLLEELQVPLLFTGPHSYDAGK